MPNNDGSIIPNAVDKLKAPIGPFPLWVWGVGAIGAYLAYRYMTTGSAFSSDGDEDYASSEYGTVGSGIPSYASDGSIQAVDPATVQAYMGEQGPAGPPGPKGESGTSKRPSRPTTKTKSGYRWFFDVQGWRWVQRKLPPKPRQRLKKGYHWSFDYSTWSWKQSRAMGGPFVGVAEVGEVGKEDVFGVGFVKPKYPIFKAPANGNPVTVSGAHVDAPVISGTGYARGLLPEYPELPNLVTKAPAFSSDRGYGRPLFG